AGKGGEPEPVAIEILYQPARFAQRAAQAARFHVFGEHRARDIDRDDEIEPAGFRDDALFTPTRPGQRDRRERGGDPQRRSAEPARAARDARRGFRPGGGAPDPRAPCPRGCRPDDGPEDRGEHDDNRRVECDHGTRTANVAATTISSANASSPIASGQRYASSYRR